MERFTKAHFIAGYPGGLLSVEQASLTLGVSRASIYRIEARGEIRFIRLGRRVLVDPTDIECLISQRKLDSARNDEDSGE